MNSWALYSVFVATVLSVGVWSYFVWREHDAVHPVELSMLAVRNKANATYYRTFMWLCPPLFAITGWWYVAPRVHNGLLVALWLISCGCCMLAGVFLPRAGKQEQLHDIFAYTMGIAMLALAFVAAWAVPKYSLAMWFVAFTMAAVAIAGPKLRHHYIFYELGLYIFITSAWCSLLSPYHLTDEPQPQNPTPSSGHWLEFRVNSGWDTDKKYWNPAGVYPQLDLGREW